MRQALNSMLQGGLRSHSSQVAQTLLTLPPSGLKGHALSELNVEGMTRPVLYSAWASLKDLGRRNGVDSRGLILRFKYQLHHLQFGDITTTGGQKLSTLVCSPRGKLLRPPRAYCLISNTGSPWCYLSGQL